MRSRRQKEAASKTHKQQISYNCVLFGNIIIKSYLVKYVIMPRKLNFNLAPLQIITLQTHDHFAIKPFRKAYIRTTY